MSHQHPASARNLACKLPDPYDFARRGAELTGTLRADLSDRLSGSVLPAVQAESASNLLTYRLSGLQLAGKHYVDLQVQGEVLLSCRRCLEPVGCSLQVKSRLLLVQPGASLPDEALEDDSFDPVHAGRDWDVLAAVEDEVLLGLPLAPAHANCAAAVEVKPTEKASPFAVLKGLKQGGN